jgi:hypothetical protein
MIIIPRENPLIRDLNSYYLNIERLVEHYQGEMGSGGIHFKSATAEGMVFFDDTALISGLYADKAGQISGHQVIPQILDTLQNNNFKVSIYPIEPDKVHYWSKLSESTPLHTDLSAEFTDLDRLIAKMQSEKLTGYIDVSLGNGEKGGLICFETGAIIECSCSVDPNGNSAPEAARDYLIQQSRAEGGIFNVNRISLQHEGARIEPPPEAVPSSPPPDKQETPPATPTAPPIEMVRDFLLVFEKTVKTKKKRHAGNFDKLLRKKFMQKAEKYEFLDPFTAEFVYSAGVVNYSGSVGTDLLLQGVVESAKELAEELGILLDFINSLNPWREKYAAQMPVMDIEL